MKTVNSGSTYWRLMTPLLLFILCALAAVGSTALAETIVLKSGEVIEGEILSETDDAVQIRTSRAGGAIVTTRSVPKETIADIQRASPEQRAEQMMRAAYGETKAYELSPDRSKPLAEYDRVINDVFRQFLKQYPNSPHTQEIETKIAAWQEERNRVAAGAVKHGGQWLTGEAAAQVLSQMRIEQLLREGAELQAQKQFAPAAEKFRAALSFHQLAPLASVENIHQLQFQFYDAWIQTLELQLQQAQLTLKSAETQLTGVASALDAAKNKLAADEAAKTAKERDMIEGDGGVKRMGEDVTVMQSRIAVSSMQKQFESAQASVARKNAGVVAAAETLAQMKIARDLANQEALQIIAAKKQLIVAAPPPPPANDEVVAPSPPQEPIAPAEQAKPVSEPPPPVALVQPSWLEKNWVWVLVVTVLLIVIYKLIPSAK